MKQQSSIKKRKYKDGILQTMTYGASCVSVLVLIALLSFIFMKGAPLLKSDILTNEYWSKNYLVQVDMEEQQSTSFERPADLHEDVAFSKRWGIGFVDSINSHKEKQVLVEYVDEASVFYHMKDISIKSNPEDFSMEVGMQIEKLQYQDQSDTIRLAGGIVSQNAQEVANVLDEEAVAIDTIYVKTAGGGIKGSILSTFYLLVVSLLLALPIGIASAIYLQEYARKSKWNGLLRSGIETLTGVPSIVFGLMGVSVLFPITQLFGATTTSILLGACTMSIILLPTIIRSTQEALLVVPQHLRDASLSVGANRSQTIFKIVLPCAIPGILTGVLLSIGRIIGESAALIYTMGTFINDQPTLTTQGTSLAVHIWSVMSGEQPNFELASAISIIILVFVLFLNLMVKLISHRFIKTMK